MPYWVYENWTIDKAIVHDADCSYCNDGRGMQATDSGRNGQWHGPYEEREFAFTVAKSKNRKLVRGCKSCSP